MLRFWGRSFIGLAAVAVCGSCGDRAYVEARTTEMMERELVKVQGRITAAHFAQCVEAGRARLGGVAIKGRVDWHVSHFLSCVAGSTFTSVFTPGENYVVYVGRAKAYPKDLHPNEKAYARFVCAWKVRSDSVELDNRVIPEKVQKGHLCTYANDANEYIDSQ